MDESYVERAPVAALAAVVRTVWIQRTGAAAYAQRHLPTGGVELHFPIGGRPRLLGPLTGPSLEVLPPHTVLVGVRFHPGTAPPLPEVLDDLVDQRIDLTSLWGATAERLAEETAGAPTAEAALADVQSHLLQVFRAAPVLDPLMREAVRRLMPWHPVPIGTLADRLAISPSQLRRRCLGAIGMGPKTLQRTLRFQGFLALAQAGAAPSGRRDADGIAGLAADTGYADHAHLTRECVRLTGVSPRSLLHGSIDKCGCGHDHAASFRPFLATRALPPPRW
ncbi:helix-turn-helix domain-containing protein [Glycomyces artemisiae]|uniref:AraC-like DNA-binding protein n=1 Tax=Glycomyces artemisiae TaxID=1076443 RepID=A0A2T0UQ55_9ACTN|nr:AraC family transcriptional regulator [Glycomyces artemisiae]PRY59998.1 AraC-like DNA-binding protein [Glycomyces artemisiae]